MGYTLTIGNAEVDWNTESVRVYAPIVRQDDAPAYGEPTDHENQRWPSYRVWNDSINKLGIYELMFGDDDSGEVQIGDDYFPALMPSHPGAAPVVPEVVAEVERALNEYKLRNPGHIAQYAPLKDSVEEVPGKWYREEDYVDDPRYDDALCRGEWLLYWLKWAIANCERPVFCNL